MRDQLKAHDAFEPDVVRVLASALDEAWKTVRNSVTFASNGHAAAARERLAQRIIAKARLGERDRQRLRDDALRHFLQTLEQEAGAARSAAAAKRSDPEPDPVAHSPAPPRRQPNPTRDAEESRQHAARCLQKAHETSSAKLKEALLAQSQAWNRLAAEQQRLERRAAERQAREAADDDAHK